MGGPQGLCAAPPHWGAGHRVVQRVGDRTALRGTPGLGPGLGAAGRYRSRPAPTRATDNRCAESDACGRPQDRGSVGAPGGRWRRGRPAGKPGNRCDHPWRRRPIPGHQWRCANDGRPSRFRPRRTALLLRPHRRPLGHRWRGEQRWQHVAVGRRDLRRGPGSRGPRRYRRARACGPSPGRQRRPPDVAVRAERTCTAVGSGSDGRLPGDPLASHPEPLRQGRDRRRMPAALRHRGLARQRRSGPLHQSDGRAIPLGAMASHHGGNARPPYVGRVRRRWYRPRSGGPWLVCPRRRAHSE